MKRTIVIGSALPRLCIIFFFALATVSCATGGSGHGDQKVKKLLSEEVDQFNNDIRWQDFDSAVAFILKANVEHYWSEADRMKRDIRLTEYEVRSIEFSEDCRSVRVLLHFQYWSVDSPILRSVTVTQRWCYDESKKVWKVNDTGFGAIIRASSEP